MKNKILLLLPLLLFVTGCASKLGGSFNSSEILPADKGLIYIYRPKKFVGKAMSPKVKVNDQYIGKMRNGGYLSYLADEGTNEVSAKTESTSSVRIDVESGETYYVRGKIKMGVLVGRPDLVVMPENQAKYEISSCRKVVK